MKITPTSLTVSQLFSSANEQFLIPAYQRRYAWTWKQIEELYDDLSQLSENDTHLLGSIVCLVGEHKAGINQLELVDGQQRITTLSIFLKALKDVYNLHNEDVVCTQIDGYLYAQGVDRVHVNKVLLGDLDNPDYLKIVAGKNFGHIKNENLKYAYEEIYRLLSNLSKTEIDILFYKFVNNLMVIRLDVSKAKDAYKLFETINNRGLRLNPTDIIKNFLLGHASTIDDTTVDIVRENWKKLIIELDGINTDDFFRHYMCSVLDRKVTFTYLSEEFKKYYIRSVKEAINLPEYEIFKKVKISDETFSNEIEEVNGIYKGLQTSDLQEKTSIVDYSGFLWKLSVKYRKIQKREFDNERINRHLYNLQRIKSFPTYIYLLDLFNRTEVDDNLKINILKLLETFMLRRHICERRTGELDDIFSKLTQIKTDNLFDDVKAALLKDLPGDLEFAEKFKMADFNQYEDRAKYILEIIEYSKTGDTGELVISSSRDVHLEHIIPKVIDTKKAKREFGDWVEYLGVNAIELYRDHINLIGNMTLLGHKLNITASNNPYVSKLNEYKKSNLFITKQLIERYSDFRYNEVKQRSEELAKEAVSIWKF